MAINRAEIKDFLVFKGDFAVDFCPGVNVLIGGNATGKTTLLRAMYRYVNGRDVIEIVDFVGKITIINSDAPVKVFFDNKEITGATYIPEKDLLSNSKGLPETAEFGKLQFTDYEIDIIKKARVAPSKPKQELVERIEQIIGGEVENDGESFFVKKTDIEIPISFSMEASGFKKFGLLSTLIRNEQIAPGTVLFWDEPENSLNPELLPVLVDILLELQRGGVQVFIATHSGHLARYFDVNQKANDKIMFYNLYKDGGTIKSNSSSTYPNLSPNVIEQADEVFFKDVMTQAMGANGDE